MISYGKQSIDQADVRAVTTILISNWLTQGPMIAKFEKEVAKKVHAKYAVACSNGTTALHLACLAAGIGPGDEVIIPTLTFVASSNCVLYCGGTPILCDVDPDTLTIDIEDVTKKINRRTKAIIGVDFGGHPADWDTLKKIAKKYHVLLIDDAAHALGAAYKGKPIGSLADITTFSFHPVKSITTGEGGMVVTNKKEYAEVMRLLRNHGISKPYHLSSIIHDPAWYQEMTDIGYNYRMTDIQAALGLSQLKKLHAFLRRRKDIAHFYCKELRVINEIILPPCKQWAQHAWHIFPIQFRRLNRDTIYSKLLKMGIKCQVHYLPIHLQLYYQKHFGYKRGDFPAAEEYFSRCLTIPLFPAMSKTQQEEVVQKLTLLF